jgi:LEA14-like dessication related protein
MNIRALACALALASLSGCAGLAMQSRPLDVTLADIGVLDVGLLEQTLRLRLRVQNPNDTDLAIDGFSFALEVNGKPFARGVSNKPVNVPRYGQTLVEVDAVTGLVGILRQIEQYSRGDRQTLTYRLTGHVSTASAGRLAFDHGSELRLPQVDSPGPGHR